MGSTKPTVHSCFYNVSGKMTKTYMQLEALMGYLSLSQLVSACISFEKNNNNKNNKLYNFVLLSSEDYSRLAYKFGAWDVIVPF